MNFAESWCYKHFPILHCFTSVLQNYLEKSGESPKIPIKSKFLSETTFDVDV